MLKFVLLCSGSAVNIRYQQPKSNTVILDGILRLRLWPAPVLTNITLCTANPLS